MTHDPSRGETEVNTGLRPRVLAAIPRLTAIAGPAQGRAFAMANALATVGRHPTNDMVLDDPRVSGVHLQLQRIDDHIRLRDAGSTNGTWLGQHRVMEIELGAGAEIMVGSTILQLDLDDAATTSPVSANDSFGMLVGRSTVMRELFATLERIAPKDIGLLIQGETGTGKEEVARAIHKKSTRADKPF
ncbi:MAG TPA: FHA domain-containing protein, partial [Polyangiaceae bacterium]|nr:FHA domain-containing protein [Polyangiaceae bacterium]